MAKTTKTATRPASRAASRAPASRTKGARQTAPSDVLDADTLADTKHPAYLDGIFSDPSDEVRALTPTPDGPLPGPLPDPFPMPDLPIPIEPGIPPFPGPTPFPPLRICGPVSGRYRLRPLIFQPIEPLPLDPGVQDTPALSPIFTFRMTVRVDVDRFYPQKRISVEASRFFPSQRSHLIATVTSDRCNGLFRRRIEANITYRDGVEALLPGVRLVFEANRTSRPFGYGAWKLTLIEANGNTRSHVLDFVADTFDDVEFEVDRVANATPVVTAYDTHSHPNRPASVPAETINLATTFRRAGFNATISPNGSTIPVADAGANGTWSDAEMHNAMVTFWSRFANNPNWAMWVLFAARHDMGHGLGGIMFDDIGPNHRQGTAIFTDSFIVDAPNGDANPAAWRNRNVYWTAVHEMGHAFNLAHAWQKSLGRPQVDGNPWIPLVDQPESRSFMNYPTRVAGGQQAFFSNFEFRFSNDELIFMRHAPRRFVQMGNENWFSNHGFEQVPDDPAARFKLHLRPNRESNSFSFLEPVKLELKLENVSGEIQTVDADTVSDGSHVAILVKREGGETARWRPFSTHCHERHLTQMKPGESLYGSHFVAASTDGWLIDEPGFYMVQAAAQVQGVLVLSNPLRIFVGAPESKAEEKLAPDYFSEDVGRVLAFRGAPELAKANDTLREVVERAPSNPAATHAAVALADPLKRNFKVLDTSHGRDDMAVKAEPAKVEQAAKQEIPALIGKADKAAETMGHIDYKKTVEGLTDALADAGDSKQAVSVQKSLIATMERRGVLKSVIAQSERKLEKLAR